MKSLTEYLWMNTATTRAFVNITPQVEELVRKSGVREGGVIISHSTRGDKPRVLPLHLEHFICPSFFGNQKAPVAARVHVKRQVLDHWQTCLL